MQSDGCFRKAKTHSLNQIVILKLYVSENGLGALDTLEQWLYLFPVSESCGRLMRNTETLSVTGAGPLVCIFYLSIHPSIIYIYINFLTNFPRWLFPGCQSLKMTELESSAVICSLEIGSSTPGGTLVLEEFPSDRVSVILPGSLRAIHLVNPTRKHLICEYKPEILNISQQVPQHTQMGVCR